MPPRGFDGFEREPGHEDVEVDGIVSLEKSTSLENMKELVEDHKSEVTQKNAKNSTGSSKKK